MITSALLTIALLAGATSSVAETPAPAERVLVTAFKADGVDDRVVKSIERAVVAATADLGFDAVSTQDLATIVDIEAARQAAGCDGESSCLAEIAGGMGANLVVTGTVVALAKQRYELALVLLDRHGTTIRNRASIEAPTAAGLRDRSGDATRALFAVDVVDNTGAFVWIGAGSAAVVVGAVVGGIGVAGFVSGLQAAGAVDDAGAAYDDAPNDRNLKALGSANEDYAVQAGAWQAQGRWLTVGGGVAIAVGVAAIVVGVVGLE